MKLTARDESRLIGVHPKLLAVIDRAVQISKLDFIVTEGVRTLQRQRELLAGGATKTLNSRHVPENNVCKQACAVDLAVTVGGEVRWDGSLYVDLAEIVAEASAAVGVPVEWGGSWAKLAVGTDPAVQMANYVARCKRSGKRPLIDGPHFQLPVKDFP